MKKRFLSIFISIVMVLGLIPGTMITAFAEISSMTIPLQLKAVDEDGNEIEGKLDAWLNDYNWIGTEACNYNNPYEVIIGENTISNWDCCPVGYVRPSEEVTFDVDESGTVTITSNNAKVETTDEMTYIVIELEKFDSTGKIVVSMVDKYGDGWNGAAIQIYKNEELIDSATFEDGFYSIFEMDIDDTAEYSFKWLPGEYDDECSYVIYVDGVVHESEIDLVPYITSPLELKIVDEYGNEIKGLFDGYLNKNARLGTADCDNHSEYKLIIGENSISNWDYCPIKYVRPTEDVTFEVDESGNITVTSDNATVETTDEMTYIVIELKNISIPDSTGKIVVVMYDEYGDGWNGAAIQIYKNEELIDSATFEDGGYSVFEIPYDETAEYVFEWSPGEYDDECDYDIYVDSEINTNVIYPVWIGDERLSFDKSSVNGTTGTATYDYETNTLTLKDFTYEGEGITFYDSCAAIYYPGEKLNVELIGENSISNTGSERYSIGIYSEWDLSVSGSGSLTVSALGGDYSYGLLVKNDIELSDCTLICNSSYFGIRADELVVSRGNLKSVGDFYGIYCEDFILESGEVVAQGSEEGAFLREPGVDNSLVDATVRYGEDELSAKFAGAKPLSDLEENYDQKYVSISVPIRRTIWIVTDIKGGNISMDNMFFFEGETATLTFIPDEGYNLKSITVNDVKYENVLGKTEITFTMPAKDLYVSAEFEEGVIVYFDNTETAWSNVYCFTDPGYTKGADLGSDIYGFIVSEETIQFTNYMIAAPAYTIPEGYFITKEFTLESDTTYEYVGYNVNVAEDITGGSVTAQTFGFPVNLASEGQTITLAVETDEGYVFESIAVKQGDTDVEVILNEDGTYTFFMPEGDVTISVQFTKVETIPEFDDLDSIVSDIVDTLTNTINEGIEAVNSMVHSAVSSVGGGIKSGLIGALDAAQSAIKNAFDGLFSIFN